MGMSTNHDLFRVVSILIADRFRQITSPLSKCNHGGLIIPLRTRAISPHRMSYRRCLSQCNIAKRYISRHGALISRRPLWAMRSQSNILSSLAQKPDATVIVVSRVPTLLRILAIFGVEQKALSTFSMSGPNIRAGKSGNPRNDRIYIGNVLITIEFQPNLCSREILVYRAIYARALKGIFMPLHWDSPAQ